MTAEQHADGQLAIGAERIGMPFGHNLQRMADWLQDVVGDCVTHLYQRLCAARVKFAPGLSTGARPLAIRQHGGEPLLCQIIVEPFRFQFAETVMAF